MIKCAVIGATGYAGAELCRLLYSHPEAEIVGASSVSFEGKLLSEVYPSLKGLADILLTDEDTAIENADVVFAAVPHGLSEKLAAKVRGKNKAFIDFGADFRLSDENDYKEWYGGEYTEPKLHEESVYCIPELFREKGRTAKLIANPGCYPTSVALGLAPAIKAGLVNTKHIIIDSKSGVTGAGRGLSQTTHYPDANEAFSPYKVACHRHTPEIEETLSALAGEKVNITFVPHLLPVNRGIVSTMYCDLKKEVTVDEVISIYNDFYKDEFFVRVLNKGETANLKTVKCSNFCDISLHLDVRTNTLIVVSTIDNMVKGAAGQAMQNMNLIFGLDEKTGLTTVPTAF